MEKSNSRYTSHFILQGNSGYINSIHGNRLCDQTTCIAGGCQGNT